MPNRGVYGLPLAGRGSESTDPSTMILTGAYASLPAAGTPGRLYLPTDSLYDHLYDNGASWDHFVGPWKCMPPVLGDFTWVNQETATAVSTYGGIYLHAPAVSGDHYRILKKSKTGIYTITALMAYNFLAAGAAPQGGFCWRQSSDGKICAAVLKYETSWQACSGKFNSPTSYNDWYVQTATLHSMYYWLRIAQDASNRICSVSLHGNNFIQVHSVGNTDFLTADEVGICANAVSAVSTLDLWCLSWAET